MTQRDEVLYTAAGRDRIDLAESCLRDFTRYDFRAQCWAWRLDACSILAIRSIERSIAAARRATTVEQLAEALDRAEADINWTYGHTVDTDYPDPRDR